MAKGMLGLSIIITTWKRDRSAKNLLEEIARSETNRPMEVIILDDNHRFFHHPFPKTIGDIPVKVISLDYNPGCWIRFKSTVFACYDTLLFLDDDVKLLSPHFISKFLHAFGGLTHKDIISSWCQKLIGPHWGYFDSQSVSFLGEDTTLVEVDIVGPGICLLNKDLLTPSIYEIPEEYREADNVWISMMTSLVHGSRKYYCPTAGMVEFRNSHKNSSAMYRSATVVDAKTRAVKNLIEEGYVPILKR